VGESSGTVWISKDGVPLAHFAFEDAVRANARAAVSALSDLRLPVRLISGDAVDPVPIGSLP